MTAKERFLKYVKYDTTSDENSSSFPSTEGQKVLLKKLKNELESFGLKADMDENGYVSAVIPATKKGLKRICFISHVDTSPAVSGKNVNPQFVNYDGGDITLKNGIKITVNDNPYLSEYVGKELIVTDGETLLGADDKAGVL